MAITLILEVVLSSCLPQIDLQITFFQMIYGDLNFETKILIEKFGPSKKKFFEVSKIPKLYSQYQNRNLKSEYAAHKSS